MHHYSNLLLLTFKDFIKIAAPEVLTSILFFTKFLQKLKYESLKNISAILTFRSFLCKFKWPEFFFFLKIPWYSAHFEMLRTELKKLNGTILFKKKINNCKHFEALQYWWILELCKLLIKIENKIMTVKNMTKAEQYFNK